MPTPTSGPSMNPSPATTTSTPTLPPSASPVPGTLSEAFIQFGPHLRRVADRGLGPDLAGKVGASDIVQDTFYAAKRDLEDYRGKTPGEFRGWLERILINRLVAVRRHFRKTAKRRVSREVSLVEPDAASTGRYPVELPAATTASPLSRVVQAERAEMLRVALAGLGDLDVQVIRWRQQDRLSFGQIGDRFEISEEAARKRWARAMIRLRDAMEAMEVTDESR